MKRLRATACWLLPSLFLLLLYWPGILAWFQADDFAWLSLWRDVHDWPSLMAMLFRPQAQGTIRPWSERGFFLLFHQWFGFDALPYRVFVFLNACGCVVLLQVIARRMGRGLQPVWTAPVAWMVTAGLAVPMTWTSDYNQIQCLLFLLGALYLRMRRVFWAELTVFVLGFGALEINAVYPALALAWVAIADDKARFRKNILQISGFFFISVIYFAVHNHFAGSMQSGPYAMHFDGGIAGTLGHYWRGVLVAPQWAGTHARWMAAAAAGVFSAAIAYAAWTERRVALFGLAWFFITLAPLLPLRDHVSDYYLTIPAAGLALTIAAGLAALARRSTRVAGLVLLAAFVAINAPAAHFATRWNAERSWRVRTLVLGVVTAHEKNPGKAILIDQTDPDLLPLAWEHSPFHAFDVPLVFLTPETGERFAGNGNSNTLNRNVLPAGPVLHALDEEKLAVYRINGDRLRNVTSWYEGQARRNLANKDPERVDVGNPLMAYLLGSDWYALEGDHRWMPQRATVRLGAPSRDRNHLVLSGWCPAPFVAAGPVKLEVAIGGEWLPPSEITKPETPFLRTYDIPAPVRGSWGSGDSVLVEIRLNRVWRPAGENRDLGLAFGVIAFEP